MELVEYIHCPQCDYHDSVWAFQIADEIARSEKYGYTISAWHDLKCKKCGNEFEVRETTIYEIRDKQ